MSKITFCNEGKICALCTNFNICFPNYWNDLILKKPIEPILSQADNHS